MFCRLLAVVVGHAGLPKITDDKLLHTWKTIWAKFGWTCFDKFKSMTTMNRNVIEKPKSMSSTHMTGLLLKKKKKQFRIVKRTVIVSVNIPPSLRKLYEKNGKTKKWPPRPGSVTSRESRCTVMDRRTYDIWSKSWYRGRVWIGARRRSEKKTTKTTSTI